MQHSNPPSVTLRVYVVFVDCPELAPVKSEAVIVGSVIAESIRLRGTSSASTQLIRLKGTPAQPD